MEKTELNYLSWKTVIGKMKEDIRSFEAAALILRVSLAGAEKEFGNYDPPKSKEEKVESASNNPSVG